MSDLLPLTPLGAETPRRVTCGALTLAETPDLALASLALRRGAQTPAPFGLTLPGPGQRVEARGRAAFWTGPGQWMLEDAEDAGTDFAAELADAAPGCSVTEQTDGWAGFEIVSDAGPGPLIALLEKLVNLDPATLGPGRATRTGLHHMGVFVIRRAENRLAVLGMRSAAGTLWHTLDLAVRRLEYVG